MSVYLAKEIWNEVKSHLSTPDRVELAESLVTIMIDHDITVADIGEEFKSDADIQSALTQYADDSSDCWDSDDGGWDSDADDEEEY